MAPRHAFQAQWEQRGRNDASRNRAGDDMEMTRLPHGVPSAGSQNRKSRYRRMWRWMEACRKRMRACWALLILASLTGAVGIYAARSITYAYADDLDETSCESIMAMPIAHGHIITEFVRPPTPYASGHRGIDIQASRGDTLLAPMDGIVSFSGKVGGKSVVSITQDVWIVSFEPATTSLRVGDAVGKRDAFGEVSGSSDHCDGRCVHWGVRKQGEYINPRTVVQPQQIRLLPVR